MGSRGYGPVKRLMLGSTANYLARHAGCSLLVLPRDAAIGHETTSDAEAKAGEPVGVSA